MVESRQKTETNITVRIAASDSGSSRDTMRAKSSAAWHRSHCKGDVHVVAERGTTRGAWLDANIASDHDEFFKQSSSQLEIGFEKHPFLTVANLSGEGHDLEALLVAILVVAEHPRTQGRKEVGCVVVMGAPKSSIELLERLNFLTHATEAEDDAKLVHLLPRRHFHQALRQLRKHFESENVRLVVDDQLNSAFPALFTEAGHWDPAIPAHD